MAWAGFTGTILDRTPWAAPRVVLVSLGINDIAQGSVPAASVFTTILDAIHSRYPAAICFVTKPWGRTFDADCDLLAAQIDIAVAARSSFARAGDDERIWVKGADDGATMTYDGIHFSASGETEKTNQMLAIPIV